MNINCYKEIQLINCNPSDSCYLHKKYNIYSSRLYCLDQPLIVLYSSIFVSYTYRYGINI